MIKRDKVLKQNKTKQETKKQKQKPYPAALFRARDAVLTTSPLARTTWKINI